MTLLRIAILAAFISTAAATDPGLYCSPGGVLLFGGDPQNCGVCYYKGETATIDLANFHDGEINVAASSQDPSVQCVKFWLKQDGASEFYYYKKEKNAPYSLYGNSGLNFTGGQPLVGQNQQLTVCSFSDTSCSDTIGCTRLNLDVSHSEGECEPWIEFIDVHDATDDSGYYKWINENDELVCLPPSGRVAIQATSCHSGCIDKVYMKLDKHGQSDPVDERTEVDEPFSLYKNRGTYFYGRKLKPGDYTITAVPNDDWYYSLSYNFTLAECDAP